ncbi:NADP-dependent oxidoreductase domain-containing protein [Corynascus novoguineensis]|uniref:NADP-dependent oxidoreductase domain-containing protein n=1 Tax=Corynascus novoguineensis TaxID=1126955 RepID=A0AAN7CMD3_9PEZI|nr:NADP-dependent oxidoreductase domain-containing protein [Corynascus novoguineensis]
MGASAPKESTTPTLRNGDPIPRIFYGTARRKGKAVPDVRTALQLGYRAIDTASSRRFHHEAEDGRALREFLDATNKEGGRLEGIFVQSKFAAPPEHVEPLPYETRDDTTVRVLKSVLRSAEDLGTEVLDAYFLHAPLPTIEGTVQAWRVLEQLVSRGAVRYLGIANVALPRLGKLYDQAQVKPAFVQNWFRKTTTYDRDVVMFCKEHHITYQMFGVFDEANAGLLECEPVQKRARTISVTTHQALLQLLLETAAAMGLQLCILDGTTSADHMRENLSAVRQFGGLPESDVESFRQLIGWV